MGLRFVLIAGMPGAGKSIVARVARELGLPVFTMGDVVREEVRRRGLEPTPANMNKVATELRKLYGKTVIAERTLDAIKKSGIRDGIIVIDGVRSLEEVDVFSSYAPVTIVAVHASPKTRFERLRARGRPGDPRTWEEFRARDLMELGFGLGNVIALADYMLVNDGVTLDEFVSQAKRLLEAMIRG
ncbi:dephospho-CoA kinase, CoaE [Pyrolobus fumarii 1A]|uniref:UPF0200 protein Pyrfu_0043 n=1 Tax=Pyrolobus fumarii (strain DSM 11204 / 1A) TaxID=694429 RepID=G0EDZ9_PYRF1|nr:dephospho-CoA kinase, CoaE [Pyrolobus fumarii 1A]